MTAPVVIFAVGNPSRGDDALGPLLCQRLANWLAEQGLTAGFELIEDFQLQIEHALDLQARQLALFIDAGLATPGPFTFRRVAAQAATGHSTHALPPEAVLQVYDQMTGEAAPPSYVLCVRGEAFELGAPMSRAATANAEAALELLLELCGRPALQAWNAAQR